MKILKVKLHCLLLSTTLLLAFSSAWAATSIVNLMTEESGLYKITYEQLLASGVDLSGVRHNRLSLTKGSGLAIQPVGVYTKGQTSGGHKRYFGPGAFIQFYADNQEGNLYSEKSAYTLHVDNSRDYRLTIPVRRQNYSRRADHANAYQKTVHIEDNVIYDNLSPSENDPYHYGMLVGFGDMTAATYSFDLDNVASPQASVDVEIFGLTDLPEALDHHIAVAINGNVAGDTIFGGSSVSTLNLNNVSVNEGANTLRVDFVGSLGLPFDAVALNEFDVHYQRKSIAENDYLQGVLPAGHFEATGFSEKKVDIYRIEQNGTVQRVLRKRKVLTDAGYTISFNVGSSGAKHVFATADGYKTPTVAIVHDDQDIQSGDADYLIITEQSFIGSELQALVDHRSANFDVKVVDVAQIYGQFGQHVPTAQAIKDYVSYAVDNLGVKYVLIVGSDTYDYLDVEGTGSVSFVPTNYIATPNGGILPVNHTPTDVAYGDLDNDGVPDVPVGRLPVRTPSELANVFDKILDYEARVNYQAKAVVVADRNDDGNLLNFTNDAESVISQMPADWQAAISSDYRAFAEADGDALAISKLTNAINSGVEVAAYIGHSSHQQWSANPALFSASDVASLTNIDTPTVVTQWGCWNTYFVRPSSNSMAETLLLTENKGAVAVLGASTLTTSAGERKLGNELAARMFQPGVTIGDAVIAAKQAMAITSPDAADILLGWQILGDPVLVIQPE